MSFAKQSSTCQPTIVRPRATPCVVSVQALPVFHIANPIAFPSTTIAIIIPHWDDRPLGRQSRIACVPNNRAIAWPAEIGLAFPGDASIGLTRHLTWRTTSDALPNGACMLRRLSWSDLPFLATVTLLLSQRLPESFIDVFRETHYLTSPAQFVRPRSFLVSPTRAPGFTEWVQGRIDRQIDGSQVERWHTRL